MAREFFDYDPFTGTTYYTEAGNDPMNPDLIHLITEQDVQPLIDVCTELRNTKAMDGGIKECFFNYARLPNAVLLEMKQKGLDPWSRDPSMCKRVRQEIERNYKAFKVTDKVII